MIVGQRNLQPFFKPGDLLGQPTGAARHAAVGRFLASQRHRLLYIAVLIVILWIGFGLRTFQLGYDSYWNDEAGQALAAIQPTLGQFFAAMRAHAMAMPLDYLVSRMSSNIGLSETIMRFPSMMWGVLTLAVCYQFFRKLVQTQVAVLATLLLALSALHVHYSQELRFYSSLTFFYYLSSLVLLKAIESPSLWRWALFILITTVGTYFHVYVLLSAINGFVWLRWTKRDSQRFYFLASVLVLCVTFIPGYMYFGSRQRFDYSLLHWGSSFPRIIAQGLGWLALPYTPQPTWNWVWGILCLGTGLLGIAVSFRQRVIGMVCSVTIQVILIVLADWVKGYWFVYRQLLHFHPFALLFSSIGIFALGGIVKQAFGRGKVPVGGQKRSLGAVVILVGIFLFASVPVLSDYYQWPKSVAREISAKVAANWLPGDSVLVVPGYQEKIYRFYLQHLMDRRNVVSSIRPTEWENLESDILDLDVSKGNTTYCIIGTRLSDQKITELESLEFRPYLTVGSQTWGVQSLFLKKFADKPSSERLLRSDR